MHRRDMLKSLLGGAVGAGLVRGSEPELKACPFCGAPPGEVRTEDWSSSSGPRYWRVVCSRCGSETTLPTRCRAEAVDSWNRRAKEVVDV